ncbi:MAG: alcohol dehydrogenase catalytic domain-containing protein [Promethearchaeota archaeon]
MKVCVYDGIDGFFLEDREIPRISPDEILVKTDKVGICGTDVHKAVHRTVPAGTVLGHEISGVVEKVGSRVKKFKVGDRVAIAHHAPCMSCKMCLKGHHSLCEQYLKTNVDPGGFSEYIRLPAENVKHTVKKIPDDMTFSEAAFMEPLACCLRGFFRLEFSPGDYYLVIGIGPIGLMFCQIAKTFNAGTVVGADINDFRLNHALKNKWLDEAYNPKNNDQIQHILDETHDGFDHIIITVGSGQVYQDALTKIRKGSNMLVFAECPENQEITIDPNLIYRNELSIVGSYSSSPRFLTMALDLIASKRIDVKELISHEMPVEKLQEAIQMVMTAGKSLKIMVYF